MLAQPTLAPRVALDLPDGRPEPGRLEPELEPPDPAEDRTDREHTGDPYAVRVPTSRTSRPAAALAHPGVGRAALAERFRAAAAVGMMRAQRPPVRAPELAPADVGADAQELRI